MAQASSLVVCHERYKEKKKPNNDAVQKMREGVCHEHERLQKELTM
jgi:hypothetical protein